MGNITFAKVMIILCLVGSGALAYSDWGQYKAIRKFKDDLRPNGRIEMTVRETQMLGKKYKELTAARDSDALAGDLSVQVYVSQIADMDDVNLGDVDVGQPHSASTGIGNTEDRIYTIKTIPIDRAYNKLEIGNFLYMIEEGSPQIRVTRLEMTQLNRDEKKGAKPAEYPYSGVDSFVFGASVTSRQRVGD